MKLDLEKLEGLEKAATAIPGWPGYAVSRDGKVYSIQSNWRVQGIREMRPHLNKDGYKRVRLTTGDIRKGIVVHYLVARTYYGPKPSPQHQVRHLNGVRTDNRVENLAWGTGEENAADRTRHGRCKASENGRTSAHKLRKEMCLRGHTYDRQVNGENKCDKCKKILNASRERTKP